MKSGVWKSGVETGFLSVLSNIILAFANNICMLPYNYDIIRNLSV